MSKITLLPVKGYEGLYEVDSMGNVYSCVQTSSRRKGKLKPCNRSNHYLYVNLYKDGKATKYFVHRLVAEAFIPNPDGLPEVNHINCDKYDDRVENLEWCDRMQNLIHSYEHGLKRRGESHGMHKLTEDEVLNIRKEYVKGDREHSLHALAEKYGVSYCTIQAIVKGRLWSYLKEGDVK